MDGAKRRLLETTLQSRFDLPRFIMLTRELLKSPKIRSNPAFTEAVLGQFRGSVKAFTNFGRYQYSDKKILLLAVQLIKNDSVARSRTMQRNFVKDQLQKQSADAALVAFFESNSPDWRISFVKIDYNLKIDYNGSTVEEDITPARRYSFLVGENEKSHTAMRQLALIIEDDITNPTLAQIEEIFNIEKVTDEFFKVYKAKYLDLKECLEGQADFLSMAKKLNFTGEEFAKKLMGQLSFLYFLQRKGWLGVTANPRSIPFEAAEQILANKPANMRDLFKKVYTLQKDRYERNTAALKNLSDQQIMTLNFFFANTPYEGKWGTGEKNFIRKIFHYADKNNLNFYRDYLEPLFYNALNEERGGNIYYRPFNCMIPFLNGGLFQPIVEEYDMDKVAFKIPNSLFSNNNLTKEGDKGDGILDIFDRYAFTVKEDEPLEKEVAVDPEMLGKVFENLLEVKDRKSKGAFYTPREIVHYMCQESLINYLVTETGIDYDDINKLIRYGDIIADADNSKEASKSGKFLLPESIRQNAKKVDNALDDIRIADPAVGSGAFPLGMINEIIRARMNLTLYLLPEEVTIRRDYAIPEERKPYNLKLRTIQHSIHAVDIERSAVEITKLRLWLSLVVDEENFSEIRPLPNLEYNIMCGNSLLEEFEGIKLFNEALLEQKSEIAAAREPDVEEMDIFTPQSQNILDEIYALQEKFFATSDSKEKIELKKQIDKHEWDLIEKSLIENGKTIELPRIRELKRLNSKPFFLWKLYFAPVFRDKGGFDVVIGNPPYIFSREKISSKEKELYYKFETAEYQLNTFVLFIEKGIKLLKQSGVLSFIIPNSILKVTSMSKSRKFMLEQGELLNILQIFGYSFENVNVEAVVLVFQKHLTGNKHVKIISLNEPCNLYERDNLIIDYSKWLADEEYRFQVSIDEETDMILEKIKKIAEPLENKFEVKAGLQAYEAGKGNPKQTAEDVKRRPYDATFKVNDNTYPYLEGRDVQRYSFNWSDSWLQYGEMLAAPREFRIFSVPRLLIREITAVHPKSILCCYLDEIYLNNRSIINILSRKRDSDELKCLLVLLNSVLLSYYFNKTTPKSERKMFPKLILKDLRQFPIILPEDKSEMVALADKMINLYKQGSISGERNIEELECKANQMVYKLYGLTPKEIEVIENLNKGE